MSALDPVVSARSAYLPTGPREEYRGERPVYRRDVGPRGGAVPGGVQASIPSRTAMTAVTTDQMSAERCEPAPAPSAEPSTSQEASAVQPTASRLNDPALLSPFLRGPVPIDGESQRNIGEEDNGGEKLRVAGFNPAQLALSPKKEQIVEAVRQGHGSYAEISAATGLTKSEVSAVIHATLILATKSRPAVLVESTSPGAKERRFEIANGDVRETPLRGTPPLQGASPSNPLANKAGGSPTEPLAVFTEGSQKDRILAAVAHGARTTTEITQRTGLLREQVHKAVGWLVKKGELQDMPSDEERTVELAPSLGTRGVHPPIQVKPASEPEPAAAKIAPTQGCGSQWNDPSGKVLDVLLSNDSVSLTALCAMTGLTRDEGLQAVDALDASLLEMKGDDKFIERFHCDGDEIWYQYMTATMDPAPQMSLAPARVAQGHPAPATDELIDQMEAAATEALSVLRDAISRLVGLARENAAARDRLAAVQKLLGGEG
ncbi:MAG: hypothetical protein ACYCY2_00795 [Acidithiobacillus ferriphilus]|uniref:hypothetical protein n=1 Tax=Acidithiobacillus ferriphilus TaxID=1689834 RepID=UPI001C075C30|nr:hypothetical protein [Acidithiobacillus ferriphilus]MBU2826802.1 hypothetical protein [Acidithiobacillus ferriphilus]MBU2846686.1 hypothetical protein [Acidithiobacillus ferriphilus]